MRRPGTFVSFLSPGATATMASLISNVPNYMFVALRGLITSDSYSVSLLGKLFTLLGVCVTVFLFVAYFLCRR